MATLTANRYLDDSAVTANEAFTLDGFDLTVRTDSRWHLTSPASMTGCIGSVTAPSALGGNYILDGQNVRWLSYDTGSGTVSAIGTTITQGGVSGYLLGVWADYTSAPTAVGASMPASGYIKFREVTGGTYSAGALTGIGASATGADVVGWIEVVHQQSSNITMVRLSTQGFKVRGAWFDLGTTSGSRQQVFQIPTNGGGNNTMVPGVFIETSVGSGVFEPWPALSVANGFTTTNVAADNRSHMVCAASNGQIIIGGDGTNSIGKLPISGLRVVIPNVIGRQCTSSTRSVNELPHTTLGTRPELIISASGIADVEYFLTDWYLNSSTSYSTKFKNMAIDAVVTCSNCATTFEIDNVSVGHVSLNTSTASLYALNINGFTGDSGIVNKFVGLRKDQVASGPCINIINAANIDISNSRFMLLDLGAARITSGYALSISNCVDMTVSDIVIVSSRFHLTASNNITVTNVDFTDRMSGNTNTTQANYGILISLSTNITVDGFTVGLNNTISEAAPYNGLINYTQNLGNIKFRNFGSYANPINSNTTAESNYLAVDGAGNTGVSITRCYMTSARSGLISDNATSKGTIVSNCYLMDASLSTALLCYNSTRRGVRTSVVTSGSSSIYGTHWENLFIDATTGWLILRCNEPNGVSIAEGQYVSVAGTPLFSGVGSIIMQDLTDEVYFETPYYVLGFSSFANTNATLGGTNTANHTLEYKLDRNDGSGFDASWTSLTGANLSAETISPSLGFKIRIRIAVNTASQTNALINVRIPMLTSETDQTTNLYPQDFTTISLTGLTANSRVQLYDVDSSTELYNAVVTGTSLSYEIPFTTNFDLRVRIAYATSVTAMEFYESTSEVTISGLSLPIAQVVDSVYVTNAVNGFSVTGITIEDDLFLMEIDDGAFTWQELYAYEVAWLYSAEGIRDEAKFITAIDSSNYIIENFQIKNISSPSLPLIITGGWGRDSITGSTIDLMDTTGGAIFSNPDLVINQNLNQDTSSEVAQAVWNLSKNAISTSGSIGEHTKKLLTTSKFIGLK